jgi:hypothetical protein
MKVKRSPLIEKLRGKPAELRKLYDALRGGVASDSRNTDSSPKVILDGKTYVVRRSPVVTERISY